jgi:hypothetical protein
MPIFIISLPHGHQKVYIPRPSHANAAGRITNREKFNVEITRWLPHLSSRIRFEENYRRYGDTVMKKENPNAAGRVRLTLDLSERLGQAIAAYADRRGVAKADVLRTAMELLLTAEKAAQEGMTVGAWSRDRDKRVEREFVGLGYD